MENYQNLTGRPKNSQKDIPEDPAFWQCFVKDAERIITANLNIKNVTNESSCHYHSSIFETKKLILMKKTQNQVQ